MDLVLATMAQSGDYRRRRQGSIDDNAQSDRLHAGSDHCCMCCATLEAEKGKAGKAVTNAVYPARKPPAAPNMAAWDSRQKERRGEDAEDMTAQFG